VQRLPRKVILEVEMLRSQLRGQTVWAADEEEPDLELPPEDERPEGQENIVQRYGQHGRELAAPEEPCREHREQRLKADEGRKAEQHADRNPARDRVRSIANLRELLLEALILGRKKLRKPAHPSEGKRPTRNLRDAFVAGLMYRAVGR
jgi:hypothetical protein